MAIEVLEADKNLVHRYYHDLESLLYVLIWICTMYSGPHGALRDETFEYKGSALCIWNGGMKHKDAPVAIISDSKHASMVNAGRFKEKVLDGFSPYFEPIKPCVEKLRSLIMAPMSKMFGETDVGAIQGALKDPKLQDIPYIAQILRGLVPSERRPAKEVFGDFRKILNDSIHELESRGRDTSKLPPVNERPPTGLFEDSFFIKPAQLTDFFRKAPTRSRLRKRHTRNRRVTSSSGSTPSSRSRQTIPNSRSRSIAPNLIPLRSSTRSSKRLKSSSGSSSGAGKSFVVLPVSPPPSSFEVIDEEHANPPEQGSSNGKKRKPYY